jgi:hypothetical protein
MEALTHEQEQQGAMLPERRGGAGTAAREGRGCQGSQQERKQMSHY